MREIVFQEEMTKSNRAFVVGLPRSGSSLLSRIFNESRTLFSVNDLYYLQKVDELDGFKKTLDKDDTVILLDYILKVLKMRSQKNSNFISGFSLDKDRFELLDKDIRLSLNNTTTWYELLDITLSFFMREMGASVWIDKTPQNFWLLDVLWEAYPDASIIFMMRQPYDVLASLKYSSGEGHNKRRYQALIYAVYWRKAARAFLSRKEKRNVMLVRYENLVADSDIEIDRLSSFLRVPIEKVEIERLGKNSSFSGTERKTITAFERFICKIIASEEMTKLGYQPEDTAPFSLVGFGDFISRTWVFLIFQLRRFVFDPDGRKRIYRFMRGS